jgi:hypothetical protein
VSNKKTIKKISKIIEREVDVSYNEGWSAGWDSGSSSALSEENINDAFQEGVRAERERIKTIFDMNIQWALESNKGSDVIFFTKAKQIIEPIDVDLSPEAYQRSLENDGF